MARRNAVVPVAGGCVRVIQLEANKKLQSASPTAAHHDAGTGFGIKEGSFG